MHQVDILRIVVASPGDVQAERDVLSGVVDELNREIAGVRGLRLDLVRWETDAYPGFHLEGPQGLIDAILRLEDCDILIGIFGSISARRCPMPAPGQSMNSNALTRHGGSTSVPTS